MHGCGFVVATRAWPDFYLQVRDRAHGQRRSHNRRIKQDWRCYRSEADIDDLCRYYLSLSQDLVKCDQIMIADARNHLKAANVEAEFYKTTKGLPTALAHLNDKYDEILRHYRDLVSAMPEAGR